MTSRQERRQKFMNGVRYFNKHIFNRFMLLFAGRKGIPFTVLHHTGRRSGRSYRTPVLATYVAETIIIPLSYGEHVDWLRNVLAHGGCQLMWQGEMIAAHQPAVLDAETGLALLPEKRREQFARFDIEKFLRLMRS
jgi:deazaflavin-dependent oxidoreductase (nitroreductase family)